MDNKYHINLIKSSCRTCLSIDIDLKSITDTSIPREDAEILYSDMLEVCTSVQIYPDDGFSNFICDNCEQNLLTSYSFRHTVLKSQETLRNIQLTESSILSDIKSENGNQVLAGSEEENEELNNDFGKHTQSDDRDDSDDIKIPDIVSDKTDNIENHITEIVKETAKIKCKRKPKLHTKKARKGPRVITKIIDRNLVQTALDELRNKPINGLDCSQCGYSSNCTRGLTSHVIQTHPELQSKWCRSCYSIFENLAEHEKTHVKEQICKCKFCDKSFFRVKNLIGHLKLHLGKSQICNICNQTLSSLKSLRKHQETHYGKIDNADLDNSINKMESNTENEIKVPGKAVHLCPYCGKRFDRQSSLVVHIRQHTGDKPYVCTECGKAYSKSSPLTRHMTIHTTRPYPCKICSKRFLHRIGLLRHMFTHSGEENSKNQNIERNEVCMVCPKRFRKPGDLRVHMRKHTGEKPFSCPECGRAFAQKRILAKHIKIHRDERPFVCRHCNRAFRHRTNLQDHIMIHTGEKPFQCKLCSYACIKRYNLAHHMRKHTEDSDTINKDMIDT